MPFRSLPCPVCFPALADVSICLTTHANHKPERALSACEAVLSAETLDDITRHEALVQSGIALRALGRFDESLAQLNAALEIAPEDSSTLRMLAWTYREMGAPARAEALYTRVLEVAPHWQGYLSRCAVRTDLEKNREAIADCDAAMAQDPSADAMYFKGLAQLRLGLDAEALATVQPGLGDEDLNGRLFFIAAAATWNMGLDRRAIALAREGLRHYPDDPDILWFLEQAGAT